MRSLRQVGLAVLALMLVVSSASAQRTPARSQRPQPASAPRAWELGLDAALSFGLDDPSTTTLSIPVANVRLGTMLTDVFELEPFFSIQSISGGGNSFTTYSLGAGGLYHFSADRAKKQLFVRPFIGFTGFSTDVPGGDDSDALIGVGVGLKWPKLGGRIAWRGEVNFASAFNQTSLNVLWGLSYWTR